MTLGLFAFTHQLSHQILAVKKMDAVPLKPKSKKVEDFGVHRIFMQEKLRGASLPQITNFDCSNCILL
jgi:hypothetical protein